MNRLSASAVVYKETSMGGGTSGGATCPDVLCESK